MVLSWATYLITIGNNINSRMLPIASSIILHALRPMTSMTDKLSEETEPVAHDNNSISNVVTKLPSLLTQLIIMGNAVKC